MLYVRNESLVKPWSNDPTLLHRILFNRLTLYVGPTFLLERMLDYVCFRSNIWSNILICPTTVGQFCRTSNNIALLKWGAGTTGQSDITNLPRASRILVNSTVEVEVLVEHQTIQPSKLKAMKVWKDSDFERFISHYES